MPNIIIENLSQKKISYTDNSKTILDILHENNIDWMHSCGKKGRCTTCKMIVLKGSESLPALTDPEVYYRNIGLLKEFERLTCQVKTPGNIIIRVPEEFKLPHLDYTD